MAKLKDEVSQTDFDAVNPSIETEIAAIEDARKALEMESGTMSSLIEATKRTLVDLVKTWREAGVTERQELQNAMFPDGLLYSTKNGFFEPGQSSLINEFVDVLESLCTVGVPDGRILNHIARARAILLRLAAVTR